MQNFKNNNFLKFFIKVLVFCTTLLATNFSEHISPIVYNNCTSCHRPGEIGAFLPLTNFDEVYSNRELIAYTISGDENERHGEPIMPPWPPDRSFSTFIGERYLTENQIHDILDWISEGAEQGDPSLEFPMPDFPQGSAIGEPDVLLEMEESYFIEGNYEDDYRCFVLETNFDEDKDIAAIEFRPGNSEAVHHAILVAVPHGEVDDIDEQDPGYGYECFGGFGTQNTSDLLGGYAPGYVASLFPTGIGQSIPANSDIILQVHYAPLNTDQTDQSSVNIFFKDEPVERYVQQQVMVNWWFELPAEEITEVELSVNVNQDLSLIQVFPHCHLLGKSWDIYAVDSMNDTIPIIRINNWDFSWQNFYTPEYMLHIPAGSELYAKCVYDNTSENPDNPNDPPQTVYWGEGTQDEMFYVPMRFVPYQEGDEFIYLGSDQDGSLDVTFQSGWTLVGLPVETDDSSYEFLFPNAYSGSLYSFNGSYVQESQLETGIGYWLRFQEGGNVEFSGDLFNEISVPVVEGWNLVTGPSEDASMSDPDGLVYAGTVYGFNGSYINADVFEPGNGYWLRSSDAGTITLSNDGFRRTSDLTFVPNENANSLTINGHELYFGVEVAENERLSYSLPPKPPAGAMDIRFSDDTKLCSTDECLIEMMNAGQPITIDCEIKDGEIWEIVDANGNVSECSGVNVLDFNGESTTVVLRKSTSSEIPSEFSLSPAYPNPFNPVTTISFSIPINGVKMQHAASLRIYDITGKLVETLVDKKLSPGNHTVQWIASQFSSGVYFSELVSGKNREVQKIILLK